MKDFKRDKSGSITIFLTLILVPCVVFISLFIDLARFEYISYKLQASSDLALNAGLTNYNSTLKEMYGLFGVSEVEETEELISEYFLSNLNVNYGLEASDNFDFYQIQLPEADSQSIGSVVNNTNLRNSDVLKHQIVEYMKYLGPYEIGTEIFDQIERFKKLKNDNEAIEKKNKIDEELQEVDEEYLELSKLISKSEEFKGYDYYDNLVKSYRSLNLLYESKEKLEGEIEKLEEDIKKLESDKIQNSQKEENEENSETDKNEELKQKNEELELITTAIKESNESIKPIYKECIDLFDDQIKNQGKIIKTINKIEGKLRSAIVNKNKLEDQYLKNTSSAVSTQLNKEIKQYDEMIGEANDYNVSKLKELVEDNERLLTEDKDAISISNKDLSYNINSFGPLTNKELEKCILFDLEKNYIIYANHKDTKEFIEFLKKYQKNSDDAKTRLNDIKTRLETLKDDIIKELDEIYDVKVPDEIYQGFKVELDHLEDTQKSDNVISDGGIKFGNIDSMIGVKIENVRDKLLAIQYAKGMFSNYRSDRDDESSQNNSYTNTPINKINNFLYQSELEYILQGKQSSRKNINATENDINVIRFGFNYIYTFTDKSINVHLNTLAAPITATLSPLAGMIFKETLRIILAELESVIDVNRLQRGEAIPLVKNEGDWNLKLDNIVAQVVDEAVDKAVAEAVEKAYKGEGVINLDKELNETYSNDGNPLELHYEDYINLFLLFTSTETLCNRIGDLIELNMTSKENNGVLGESLSYELKNTYTYFQIDSELEADFIFMRLPFVNLFLDEGIRFEKRSMKYKDIKGY